MERLLILSDDPSLHTGLGRCSRELAQRLSSRYELSIAGWHHAPVRHSFPYHIYPLIKGDPQEAEQLMAIMQDARPQKLLCIGDIWDFSYIANALPQYRSTGAELKTYLWTTPDGEWTQLRWEEVLRLFDKVSSFSHFGAEEIKKIASVDCPVIYPGVDTNVFSRPKKIAYGENSEIDPRKMFGIVTVAQNTSRKNLPIALEAFAEFLELRPNSHYVMLTNPDDPAGFRLLQIAKWLGLLDMEKHGRRKLSFIRQRPRDGITDQKLVWANLLGHCFLMPSVGEGACLPLFEAMALGLVPVATDYSAMSEVVGDRGIRVKVGEYLFGAYDVRRAIASKQSIVDSLLELYDDWDAGSPKANKFAEEGRAFAVEHSWERTTNGIVDLLETQIEKPTFVYTAEPKRKEICMAIPSWNKACGIAEYTKNLIESLQANGDKVIIFPSNDLMQLPRLQGQSPFGIVHIQHEYSFYPDKFVLEKAIAELRKAGMKVVLTLHSAVSMPAYNRMLFDSVDRIILHAESMRQYLFNGAPSHNSRIVPMGCGGLASLDGVEDRRERLGITGRKPIVGSFGFLRDQKGFHLIVQAIKQMREQYPEILFLLISTKHEFGSDEYDERFYRFVRNEGMDQHVMIYREHMPDDLMIKTLQCADVFVMNYMDMPGGLSSAIKAVMRTQRPIIAAKSFAFSDLSEEVAWLDDQRPETIASAIGSVLNSPALQQQVVEAANLHVQRHAWTTVAKAHREVYDG